LLALYLKPSVKPQKYTEHLSVCHMRLSEKRNGDGGRERSSIIAPYNHNISGSLICVQYPRS